MPRNYIAEAHSLDRTYRTIAKELGVTAQTVSRWSRGISRPSVGYEPLRNVYRRAAYSFARESFYTPTEARGQRRAWWYDLYERGIARGDEFDEIIKAIWREWNRNHPDPSDPKHISLEEVKKRVQKGLDSGKSKEEIENY